MGSSVGVGDVVVVLFAGMGAFFSLFPSPRLHQFALSICLARNVGMVNFVAGAVWGAV